MVVGLAVVALLCWRETRLQRGPSAPPAGSPARSVAQWSLLVTGSLLALTFCFGAGVFAGALLGEEGSYHRRYREERDVLTPVLGADPAFAGVEVRERSDGGAYLVGEVPTAADLERLRVVAVRAIGEAWAKEALPPVLVKR
jgi:hypothetical protein